ncbi:putative leucine-rich repeat receptor-like protein kinase [Hibiscus syriacus]|uniref:Leucine-rich repeat receptor-like protein kinase n=1 Tax=Hibiscus syriacus TaxID=106335 RepID=A0A6A3ANV5_HIBSY|nr:UPF0496 protein At3g19330-like [Hibiscus syriacus]KAE8705077.1 putative leucine-rich repeat receptor-like protein kinase [Hibiscus syriacus]
MQCLSFNLNSSAQSFPSSPQSQHQSQTHPNGLNSCPPPNSQGNSTDETPRSSTTQLSPSFNLTDEYTRALQTNSYNEIRSRIEDQVHVENSIETDGMEDSYQLSLSQVLHPNRESVHQALRHTDPKATLTRLVSTYFDHSESISTLCLELYKCISNARFLYGPVTELLQVFPNELSSINHSQCDWAFDIFLKFNSLDNPFPSPDSHNFNEMRRSFSQLKEQLDQRLHKSRSRGRILDRAMTRSAICLIGTVLGVAVTAVVISTHALAAIVGLFATPLCPIYVPSRVQKKHIAQLDAAASGSFFHIKDLDTIVCLVAWLHDSVERDKELIRFGLERGRDIYPIHEVVKHLRNNHGKIFDQLKELEEHICLCFNAINKFRGKLLEQIHLHQYTDS